MTDIVERLRRRVPAHVAELSLYSEAADYIVSLEDERLAERKAILKLIEQTRAIVSDGALTGFNCHNGDWAIRLFANQAALSDALRGKQEEDE